LLALTGAPIAAAAIPRLPESKRLDDAHKAFVAATGRFAQAYNAWVDYTVNISPASPEVMRQVTEEYLKTVPDAWLDVTRHMERLQSIVGVIHRQAVKGNLRA
jgi:hypothetical protein